MKSGAKRLKTALAFIFAGAMLVSATVFASSARRTETIDVTYDNIQIVLDGKTVDAKDALGNKVEPFIYNGTTYLPVRAVGEAFGKEVGWDGSTMTVYIGAKPGEHESWLIQCPPYKIHESIGKVLPSDGKYLKMSGKDYNDCLQFNANKGASFALFNLDGKYESFTFTLGIQDDSAKVTDGVFNIYLDDKLAHTENIEPDALARQITVPTNGALQMKLELAKGTGWFLVAGAYFE